MQKEIDDYSLIADPKWRLNNLYHIIDKDGFSVPFVMNPIQEAVLDGMHKRSLILKCRQVGMSTFSVLYMLDQAIFNEYNSCGIVSYSLEHASHIYKKIIGHAIDTMNPKAKALVGVTKRSAREIGFRNGSSIRVDTTLRGGTTQNLLVSEFGKICARNPIKADEVITGTLQSVPKNGRVIIESTGEGSEGYFYEMCTEAMQRSNDKLSDMQFKLFFFPWWMESHYTISDPWDIEYEDEKYFKSIEKEKGIKLTLGQKNWYCYQKSILGSRVQQEYPSTENEGFISTSDAYYFQQAIDKAYKDNRCLHTSLYDPVFPVYAAMDIGVTDLTVISFFQVVHGEIRFIDYYADNKKPPEFYANFMLKEKPYRYKRIFLPHDAKHVDGIEVDNTNEREMRRCFAHTETSIRVLPRTDKNKAISNAVIKTGRTVFALNKVKDFVGYLLKYRKKWSEQYGKYLDKPMESAFDHYPDSYIYMMQAITEIESSTGGADALAKHRKAVAQRSKLL